MLNSTFLLEVSFSLKQIPNDLFLVNVHFICFDVEGNDVFGKSLLSEQLFCFA